MQNKLNTVFNLSQLLSPFFRKKNAHDALLAVLALPEFSAFASDWLSVGWRTAPAGAGAVPRDVVPRCPFLLHKSLKSASFVPPGARSCRKKPEAKYPVLFSSCRAGVVPRPALVSTFQQRLKERPLVYSEADDRSGFVFHGSVKGCPEYNQRLESKISAKSAELVAQNSAFYFLTLTYSVADHGTDIIEAWRLFSKQLYKFMHSIRRKYGGGYACVLESTARGYPHAHILLGLPRAADIKHELMKPGQKYKYGKLVNFIKLRTPSPNFTLQKADPYGLQKYLTKYVAKGLEKFGVSLTEGMTAISGEDAKALMSCLLPVLAGIRQFRSSVRSKHDTASLEAVLSESSLDKLRTAASLGIFDTDAVASLVLLLNNLTVACRSHVWAFFSSQGKKAFHESLGFVSDRSRTDIQDFKRAAYPLGCPGCAITRWLDKQNGYERDPVGPLYVPPFHAPAVSPVNGQGLSDSLAYFSSLPDSKLDNVAVSDYNNLIDMGYVVENGNVLPLSTAGLYGGKT